MKLQVLKIILKESWGERLKADGWVECKEGTGRSYTQFQIPC